MDGSGDAWVAGYTASSDFPTVNPFQSTFGGYQNGFITEVNSAGTAWAYSTYFGGLSQTSYSNAANRRPRIRCMLRHCLGRKPEHLRGGLDHLAELSHPEPHPTHQHEPLWDGFRV